MVSEEYITLQRLTATAEEKHTDPYAETPIGEDWKSLATHLLARLAVLENNANESITKVAGDDQNISDTERRFGWMTLQLIIRCWKSRRSREIGQVTKAGGKHRR